MIAAKKEPASGTGEAARRLLLAYVGGAAALAALLLVSLAVGEARLSARTVFEALTARDAGVLEHTIVWGVRMPRAVIGIVAGAGLAVAGALLQTVTRNPLASASTLGINAGAFFLVVAGTVFFPAALKSQPLLFAAAGGAGAALLAFAMAGGRSAPPIRMTLSGMIVSMVLASFTGAIQLFYENATQSLFMWGSGSLVQLDWTGVTHAWPWVAGGLAAALLFSRQFDVLALDEESARSLGQRSGTMRLAGAGLAVLLAAAVVSVVGPIGFVGLVAPHLVRLMGMHAHRALLPAAALWGAALVTGADIVARAFRSTLGELPAGAVTAAVGAPWLIYLVLRRLKAEGGGASSSMSVGFRRRRAPFGALALAFGALLLAGTVGSLAFGGTRLPLGDVVAAVFGQGDGASSFAVLQLRLPRTLVAVAAGMALALSGLLMQTAVRNPLADASVIGVTQGAAVGALLLIVVYPEASAQLLPFAAMAGAAAAAAAIFGLAWRRSLRPTVVILLGVAMSAVCSAIVQVLVIQSKLGASAALVWLSGSTYARTWSSLWQIGVCVAIALAVVWWMGRRLDLLAFQDDSATGLGLPVRNVRLAAAGLAVAISGVAVANVGTIGFLGLIAPHAVRLMVGQHSRQSAVLSALLGGLLLVAADTVGRTMLAPKEIPSGLVVSLLGTPYFLYLMYRSRADRRG
ncbi:iron ABC transporter permease [Paenibacillus sp.]|uniref:iron ABC transporter permease n=1 Tax=Paenibacillus sp. TaxID=58172 RepID=UPI002811D540|nr:iron ABC transporter permease [Paenibacillus sp.]